MKILKLGKRMETEIKRKCTKCDTVFSFGFYDYGARETFESSNYRTVQAYVSCPNCGNMIILDDLTERESEIMHSPKGA
jgi:predicted RNA-binding Zn-ribbon protein involved in translation (DUF1610 family)